MFGFITLGALVSIFFLIVVPWFAISARGQARRTEAGLARLREDVARLTREIDAARAQSEVRVVPEETVKPRRKARPAARTAPEPVITEQAQEPSPQDVREPGFRSPWQTGTALNTEPGPPAAVAPSAPVPQPQRDFEEVIGTRWAIWVGGAALALGAIFLVRYTIEAGFFGPLARIAMGAMFSLLLVAAGEALRRGVLLPRKLVAAKLVGSLPPEHAPLALTAAGTVGLFATVYAAYALYGLLSPTAVFVLLGVIGLGAMAASVVHGQALAALGLIASYATPLLIGGGSTNRWPLVVFLLTVTGGGLFLHNRIRKAWIGWAVVAGVAGWTLLLIGLQQREPVAELGFMLAAILLFSGAFLGSGKPRHALLRGGDPLPLVALSGLLGAIGLSFVVHGGAPALHAVMALLAVAVVVAAVVLEGRAGLAILAAALLPLGMVLTWPSVTGALPVSARVVAGAFLVITEPPRSAVALALFAVFAAALLALPAYLVFLGRITARSGLTAWTVQALALTGGLAAPVLVFAWAIRSGGIAQNLPAALILLALAFALAAATRHLLTRSDAMTGPGVDGIGAGGYGAGAALALGLAIALALPGLWMAVGFAIAAVASAVLQDRQPLPMLRRVTSAFATTAVVRAVTSPVWQHEAAWPVLNSYVMAYGVPALLLAGAAGMLARAGRDRSQKTVLINAGVMAAIYLAYTIRHAFHGADLIDRLAFGLGESGLYCFVVLGAALLLFVSRERVSLDGAAGLRRAIAGLNGLGVALVILLVLVVANPWLEGRISGPPVVNSTFVGFLLPAVLLGVLAYFGRTQPVWFPARLTTANRGLAIALGYFYLLAQTRLMFVGQERFIRAYTGQAEHYAYSAVTLAFGVLLLTIGFRLGSRPTRQASAIFVTLAVLKIFLFDMAELEGLLRAVSFIGLGIVLIGIGLAYQRVLFDRRPAKESRARDSLTPESFAPDQPGGKGVVP